MGATLNTPGARRASDGIRVIHCRLQPGVFISLGDNLAVYSPNKALEPGEYHLWSYEPANLVTDSFHFSSLLPAGVYPPPMRIRAEVAANLPEHYLIRGLLPFFQHSTGLVQCRPSQIESVDLSEGLDKVVGSLDMPKQPLVMRTPHFTIHNWSDHISTVSIPGLSTRLQELIVAA